MNRLLRGLKGVRETEEGGGNKKEETSIWRVIIKFRELSEKNQKPNKRVLTKGRDQ